LIIRSRAPLRLSFGGGGTDVSPYMDEHGGAALNVTIDKYAYASMRITEEKILTVQSLDYDILAKYEIDDPLPLDGELDLVKAVIKSLNCNGGGHGLEFFLHCDAPPGSGLGSSSTMCVALLGLLQHWKNLPLTDYQLAERAFEVERVDLAIAGGRQDQYAAVFGGVNFTEFSRSAVVVNALRVKREILNELQYLCLLCYTGRTRMSDNIIRQQQEGVQQGAGDRIQAMHEVKSIAVEMKNALLRGRLQTLGDLLHAGWEAKKRMAGGISNPTIDELYDTARRHGAIGGKVTGAGGGGYMLFICEFDKKHVVAAEVEKLGAQVVEFAFDLHGLQTWEVTSQLR